MDNRGVTPVVSETLVIGLVLVYIGLVTAVLYASVLPEYRAASGDELGDRVLTTATERVQQGVTPAAYRLNARISLELPETIHGRTYSIGVTNRTLVLDHPHPKIGGRARLSLPLSVREISGHWVSHTPLVVRIVGDRHGYRITIGEGHDGTTS